MLNSLKLIATILFLILLISCSSNTKLIYKDSTEYGRLKFYIEKKSSESSLPNRIYATIDSSNTKIYYSFYSDRIVKTTSKDPNLSYTLFYGQIEWNPNSKMYGNFSSLDSLILSQGDKLIESNEYTYLKKSKGANGYLIEVVYYHGFPKNKRLKP
jgi:hypothetical protein